MRTSVASLLQLLWRHFAMAAVVAKCGSRMAGVPSALTAAPGDRFSPFFIRRLRCYQRGASFFHRRMLFSTGRLSAFFFFFRVSCGRLSQDFYCDVGTDNVSAVKAALEWGLK